jgi:hypothetical protein
MPPGAKASLDAATIVTEKEVLKGGVVAYAMFLVAIPTVWLYGVTAVWPVLLAVAQVMFLMGLCIAGVRRKTLLSARHAMLVLFAHCALLATMSIVLGPLLLVPILLFGSATIMFTASAVRAPTIILSTHLAVLVIPLALELVGVLPRTFELVEHGLVLRPWAIQMTAPSLVISIVSTVVLQMIGNMIMLDRSRMTQARNAERIHMQAWQLKQLVPSSGSTR